MGGRENASLVDGRENPRGSRATSRPVVPDHDAPSVAGFTEWVVDYGKEPVEGVSLE